VAKGAATESRRTIPGSHATTRKASAAPGKIPTVNSATYKSSGR